MFEAGQGDPGAHGRFDDKSSLDAFPYNPGWLRAGFAVVIVALAFAVLALAVACVI